MVSWNFRSGGGRGVCSGQCQSATTPICRCSCGGANHGVFTDSNDSETRKARKTKQQDMINNVTKSGGSIQSPLFGIFPDTFKTRKKSKRRTKEQKQWELYMKLKYWKELQQKKDVMKEEIATELVKVKTLKGYQKEFDKYGYLCRWCEGRGKPTELGEVQIIADGEPSGWDIALGSNNDEYVTIPKDRVTKVWVYAECLECDYQWALWKLRKNSQNEWEKWAREPYPSNDLYGTII